MTFLLQGQRVPFLPAEPLGGGRFRYTGSFDAPRDAAWAVRASTHSDSAPDANTANDDAALSFVAEQRDLSLGSLHLYATGSGEYLPGGVLPPGTPVDVSVRISNLGNAPVALRSTDQPRLELRCNGTPVAVAMPSVELASGGSVEVRGLCTSPATPTWRITATLVDSSDVNPGNNVLEVSMRSVPLTCDLAVSPGDLRVLSLGSGTTPPYFMASETCTVQVTVHNSGAGPAPASRGSLEVAGRYTERVPFEVPALAPGEARVVTVPYRFRSCREQGLPPVAVPVPCTFTVRLDDPTPSPGPNGAIVESNESNNSATFRTSYLDS